MRKVAIGLILLVAILAGGWSAAWFYAANEAAAQLDAWLKAEASQGRTWTCPERAIGGYPFAITVTCATPSFTAQALGQTVQVGLAGLVAEARVYHPQSVAIALRPPLTYKTSDGQTDLKATWSRLAIDLDGLQDIDGIMLNGANVTVDGTFGEMGRQGGKAARLDARFHLDQQTTEPTLAFDIKVDGAPVPALDAILGGDAPADIALAGRIDKADAASGLTPADVIEHWRRAGGTVALATSRIARGESSVTGSGSLGLDDAHRPKGRIDASFVGLDQLLKRYGISGNVAAAGNLLSSLFGGRPKQQQTDPNALDLPITFQNGRLGVGPIRTQIAVPPLY